MRSRPPAPAVAVLLVTLTLLTLTLLTLTMLVLAAETGADAAPLPADHAAAADPAPEGPPRGGAVRPVPGAVVRHFDPPEDPYGPGHRGVDLAAGPGDPVTAALSGTIAFSGRVAGVGWVTVDHGGHLTTTYGPLEERRAAGSAIATGQVLGLLGHLGDAPPTHLDWGARLDGAYIDPLLLLGRWQPRLTADTRCREGVPVC
ncbi:MAG TPA: M23 family metallopeptidase [Euzebya sp.]|nr:M23 family metallopeptidase [Euzebya sp.]